MLALLRIKIHCTYRSIIGVPQVAHTVKNCLQWGRSRFDPWIGKIPCRREWPPALVFLPGKSHGQKKLAGYSPWGCRVGYYWATNNFTCLLAQMVKNLLAMQETWVWSLGLEDPLEREMSTHSSILAWRILSTEEPGRLPLLELQSPIRLSN